MDFSLPDENPLDYVSFSPDGKRIATFSQYGDIFVIDLSRKVILYKIKVLGLSLKTSEIAHVKLDFNNEGTKIIVPNGRRIHSFDISYILE